MERRAILLKFCIESRSFSSRTERNIFFRRLYGWRQVVKKGGKRYVYHREGLIERVPCSRIDRSMILIQKEYVNEILNFLKEWEDKVRWRIFNVLIENEKDLEGFMDE